MEKYPGIVDDALEHTDNYLSHLVKNFKIRTCPNQLDCKETAELIMGKCELSQRSYKNLKLLFALKNIKIPSYEDVREYCNRLDTGKIENIHKDITRCKCMGYQTNLRDTLQHIVSCPDLLDMFKFLTDTQQSKLFDFLKKRDHNLFKALNVNDRTIVVRDTGDNFRASSRYPTEQLSFSVLNMEKMVNSPYGQFISNLWRGGESREILENHGKDHYLELSQLVHNGVVLNVNGQDERFNVIVLLVADLCFTKEILGRCQCTHQFGCFHCELESSKWNTKKKSVGEKQSIAKMKSRGEVALKELGCKPNKDSAAYKKLTKSLFGQWVSLY